MFLGFLGIYFQRKHKIFKTLFIKHSRLEHNKIIFFSSFLLHAMFLFVSKMFLTLLYFVTIFTLIKIIPTPCLVSTCLLNVPICSKFCHIFLASSYSHLCSLSSPATNTLFSQISQWNSPDWRHCRPNKMVIVVPGKPYYKLLSKKDPLTKRNIFKRTSQLAHNKKNHYTIWSFESTVNILFFIL